MGSPMCERSEPTFLFRRAAGEEILAPEPAIQEKQNHLGGMATQRVGVASLP